MSLENQLILLRKELNNLSSAGYLEKHNENNKVVYKANASHPLFKIIQKIVKKHLGIEEILETVLKRIGECKKNYDSWRLC